MKRVTPAVPQGPVSGASRASQALLRREAAEYARRHEPEIEEDEGGGLRLRDDRKTGHRRGKRR